MALMSKSVFWDLCLFRGVQLVEREEEVCIFYEKINVQDAMLKNGEIRNNELDDEIK